MNFEDLKLSSSQIITDPATRAQYGKDWTTYFNIQCSAVFFPKSTEDVVNIVKWANIHKMSLVPSGGRTGLSGGACALHNEIVVSFERMNQIKDFNSTENTVVCESGVITEALQNFAKEKNLFYPVDFAARGSSQIGGNIATNAGGIKVIRYGLTRQWVNSLTVVTGKGDVLKLNKSLVKNATGYDLRHLFIGSEGTLGFITEATMQLTQTPPPVELLFLGCSDLESVLKTFELFNKNTTLTAFEMLSRLALHEVLTATHLPKPLETDCEYYIVLEVEKKSEHEEELIHETLEKGFSDNLIVDGVISQSDQQFKNFWRYREDISESLSKYSPYKNDISVRISLVSAFINELDGIIKSQYPTWKVVWFGHIGDGNLHLNILRPESMSKEDFVKECQKADQQIFKCIQKFEGSISAEHGVGLTKKPFLSFCRSQGEIQLLREIKKIFDPQRIINPGKLID